MLVFSSVSIAATRHHAVPTTFIFEQKDLKPGLVLPVTDQVELIKLPEEIIQKRLLEGTATSVVEPLTVTVGVEDEKIAAIAKSLASDGNSKSFEVYLKRKALVTPATDESPNHKSIVIDPNVKDLIKPEAISNLYAKPHHNLTVSGDLLKDEPAVKAELLRQVTPFFTKAERDKLKRKIKRGLDIDGNSDLLPDFARRMVRKFIPFRGPNCFHAALTFQSPKFTSSSLINIKEEQGYHRAMINYDELWKSLNEMFYEVTPDKSNLAYGDMVVFFDVPMGKETLGTDDIDFRWIRHTATYLFNGYTFSKGSKSSNTPYAVRTVSEEWRTWERFTKNLGVKVYRRSPRATSNTPPPDQFDWLY
jgi:hypothetical protein